ncbi:hypothetical protein HWC80_gp071 [Mycobacterium phage Indlulamithi]|uniref:Uncharacterized protein n=1 Tax=Mycobacterium phage Indlulamithi TaxID=2656582 RepID=A0A649VCQ8_9CAUD|nr:hypothetical protein HWC80_gp071 [Mycobacterium phage Indlulamithi]QGJ90140.1 hypothetical protein PBI_INDLULAMITHI_103 [Mycobacterium phage Indlulamithi]
MTRYDANSVDYAIAQRGFKDIGVIQTNDQVVRLIEGRNFQEIPVEYKSRPFEDANPWPPKMFRCSLCRKDFDSIDSHLRHDRCEASTCFCRNCGESVDLWDGDSEEDFCLPTLHECSDQGRHSYETRTSATYYVRVTGFGNRGKHHYDPTRKQFVWVESLTDAGKFRMVSNKTKPMIGRFSNGMPAYANEDGTISSGRIPCSKTDFTFIPNDAIPPGYTIPDGMVDDLKAYVAERFPNGLPKVVQGRRWGKSPTGGEFVSKLLARFMFRGKKPEVDEDDLDDCQCDCAPCQSGNHCEDILKDCYEGEYDYDEHFYH